MLAPVLSSVLLFACVMHQHVSAMQRIFHSGLRTNTRLFQSFGLLMDTPIVLSSLQQIIDRYDLILWDQFGTIHDGHTQIPGALEVFEYLSKNKKTSAIVSNTSNRRQVVADKLTKLGFPEYLYDGGITCSGECAYEWIIAKHQAEKRKDKIRCCWFTWNSSLDGTNFLSDLDDIVEISSSIENAELILFHGTECVVTGQLDKALPINFSVDGNLDDPILQQMLTLAVHKKIPALCANLDYTAMTPNGLRYMPGNLEKEYIRLGGSCTGFGKPHKDFFQLALEKAEIVHRKKFPSNNKKLRALHIGDSIHHDIVGATNCGIDSVLVTEHGIHRMELEDTRKPPIEKSVDAPWESPPEKSLVQKVCDLCDNIAEGVRRPSYIIKQCTL